MSCSSTLELGSPQFSPISLQFHLQSLLILAQDLKFSISSLNYVVISSRVVENVCRMIRGFRSSKRGGYISEARNLK